MSKGMEWCDLLLPDLHSKNITLAAVWNCTLLVASGEEQKS